MNPKLWLNRENLTYNFRQLKKQTSSSFVCPMVKANAYGVGDSLVVSSLLSLGVEQFGVARLFEAEKLRRAFPHEEFDILVFHPLLVDELESYICSKITPVISSLEDLMILVLMDKDKQKNIKPLHLKFDLGMSRLGFNFNDLSEIQSLLNETELKLEGVCGHFSTADDFDKKTGKSRGLLEDLVKLAAQLGLREEQVHLPNSEALLKGRFNVGIRPGLSLYGVTSSESNLKGALRLTAPVVSVRSLKEGESVSYGGTWTAKKEAALAVLPIGYADGLRRQLSNQVSFACEGIQYKQVGSICMDYCMVLLDSGHSIKSGDDFVLFDEGLKDLYNWAELMGTIPYEVLTNFGDRIDRRVI